MAPPTASVYALAATDTKRHWVSVGRAHWLPDEATGRTLVITLHGEPYAWHDGQTPRELRVEIPRTRLQTAISHLPRELAAWVAAQPPKRLAAAAEYLRAHGYATAADELTRSAPAKMTPTTTPKKNP